MSLFGQIAGQALNALANGGAHQGDNTLVQIAGQLLQENGGVAGLLQKFNAAGLGDQVSSWVGTGANEPVDASQITQALGHGTLSELASKFGLSTDQISGNLAQLLPQIIDKLTPHGTTEGSHDLLQQGLSALGGLFEKPAAS